MGGSPEGPSGVYDYFISSVGQGRKGRTRTAPLVDDSVWDSEKECLDNSLVIAIQAIGQDMGRDRPQKIESLVLLVVRL